MVDFIHLFSSVGAALPSWVLGMTAWTGALLAAAWAVDRLLRRRVAPRWRAGLYVVVFARLAVPVDWASPLGWRFGAGPAALVTDGAALVDAPVPQRLSATGPAPLAAAELSRAAPPTPSTPTTPGWDGALAALYVIGFALVLGYLGRSYQRLGAIRAASRAANDGATRYPVLVHANEGPFACGVRSPVIVVPEPLRSALSADDYACVLAHEQAHLDRRDPLVAFGLGLACALAWPVIPVWIAAHRIRALAEQAADQRASEAIGAAVYGHALVRMAQQPQATPPPLLATGMGRREFAALRGRVEALDVRAQAPMGLQIAAVGCSCAALLACAGIEGAPRTDVAALSCAALEQRTADQHQAYEESREEPIFDAAKEAYESFAGRCDAEPGYADRLYSQGELLWSAANAAEQAGDTDLARERFAAANGAFMRALKLRPALRSTEAAYGQLLAKWNATQPDFSATRVAPTPRGGPPGEREGDAEVCVAADCFAPSAYLPQELELLASYDAFEAHVDDLADPNLQKVLYHRAKLAITHDRLDEAERAARRLLDGSDGTEFHVRAAEILVDTLTIRWLRDPATADEKVRAESALERWLERLPAMAFYTREDAAKLRASVPKLHAGLLWKRALRMRDAGDAQGCADGFGELLERWPDHDNREAILSNATQCLQEAGHAEGPSDPIGAGRQDAN